MIIWILMYLGLALLFALFEIQIEGKKGWASSLPTWKKEGEWTEKLLCGRPLTGYHICLVTIWFLIAHIPLAFMPWTIGIELIIFGLLIGFSVIEDFLWFVCNPHYGLKKFRKDNPDIWWHRNWIGPFPDFYWFFVLIGGVLLYLGYLNIG